MPHTSPVHYMSDTDTPVTQSAHEDTTDTPRISTDGGTQIQKSKLRFQLNSTNTTVQTLPSILRICNVQEEYEGHGSTMVSPQSNVSSLPPHQPQPQPGHSGLESKLLACRPQAKTVLFNPVVTAYDHRGGISFRKSSLPSPASNGLASRKNSSMSHEVRTHNTSWTPALGPEARQWSPDWCQSCGFRRGYRRGGQRDMEDRRIPGHPYADRRGKLESQHQRFELEFDKTVGDTGKPIGGQTGGDGREPTFGLTRDALSDA